MQGQWQGTWGGNWLGGATESGNPIVIAAIHASGAGTASFSPIAQTAIPEYQYDGSSRLILRRIAAKRKREDEELLMYFM